MQRSPFVTVDKLLSVPADHVYLECFAGLFHVEPRCRSARAEQGTCRLIAQTSLPRWVLWRRQWDVTGQALNAATPPSSSTGVLSAHQGAPGSAGTHCRFRPIREAAEPARSTVTRVVTIGPLTQVRPRSADLLAWTVGGRS